VDALAGWPGVTAFVEIKRSSLRRFGREAVLRRVSQVLRPVLDRCVLISFDLPTVKILRLMTGARVGWVLSQYDGEALAQATELAPQFLFCNLERLPAEPEPLWPGPWEWALYEVRDLKTARDCHARGARFVETMAVRGLLHAYAESRRQW
jgi:glycerophosphoryl diester phosphodiesterase